MVDAEWSIVLTDDVEQQELNRRHRGVDRTTDVLSFPMDGDAAGAALAGVPALLGDVVISVEQAARQAGAAGELEAELVRLLVHGLCHLRGMDHRGRAEASNMQREEARLLSELGVPFTAYPAG